jgi:hypothetical protein
VPENLPQSYGNDEGADNRSYNLEGAHFLSFSLARWSCFSLEKVPPGLFGFGTIFTSFAAGNFQRLDDLPMLLKDVRVTQNVG